MTKLERAVNEAKPIKGKLQRFWDERKPGAKGRFGLRISGGGKRVYILRRRGTTKDETVVDADTTSLDEAREIAEIMLDFPRDFGAPEPGFMRRGAVLIGGQGTKPQSTGPTVAAAFSRFFDDHCASRIERGRMKPKTVKDYRNQYRAYVADKLGSMPVASVTRQDVKEAISGLPAYTHNRVLALLSRFFNLCDWEWDYRAGLANPTRGIERNKEKWRKRTLSAKELGAFASALNAASERHPHVVDMIRFLLATPRRISEAINMRWVDIDLDRSAVRLPDTKAGEEQVHALSPDAMRIVNARQKVNEYVFTTGDHRAARLGYSHVRKTFQEIVATAGLANVRLHDLRRTIATVSADAGASTHQLKAMLGHKTSTMAERYVGALNERDTVDAASARVAAMMRGNVEH